MMTKLTPLTDEDCRLNDKQEILIRPIFKKIFHIEER